MAGAHPHGLCPSEAVAFLAIECERAPCPRPCLATVEAVATASEPHPYYDRVPTMADGLALVCREALREANVSPAQLDAVLLDMDGEHHRAHEWALVQSRCLAPADSYRLVHPADSYGSIGAASGVAMLALVSSARAWLDGTNLILMSDDEGPRGGVVLRRQHQGH